MSTKPDPNEPVSRAMLDDAVATLLQGMDKLYERFKGETDGLRREMRAGFGEVNTRLDRVEDRLDGVEAELSFVKDEVNGLKAEFSTTPSRREFNKLKERVDKSLPLS